jgi:thiol-disulfide isomerase/thioredoxin
LLFALLAGCEGKGRDWSASASTATAAAGGTPAPPLSGKTIDGDAFDLKDLRGKVVLVNVWATWCAPCREEFPELARLAKLHADRGFEVVGVSVDRRNALRAVKQMVTDFSLPYPVVFDPESESIGAWEIRGYPTSFLVDRDGVVRWRRDGIIREGDADFTTHLEAALGAAK